MYNMLFGSGAAFLLGYMYGMLLHQVEITKLFKKNLIVKFGVLIARTMFLIYFGKLILKIYELPLILLYLYSL